MLRRTRTARTSLVAVALGLALAGCSGDDAERTSGAAPAPERTYTAAEDVPVLVPGKPGESPQVVQPGQQGTLANSQVYVEADVRFMTDMVPHHAQALEMAQLAPERAADPRVKKLAERIAVAQGPEIEVMQQWLRERGHPEAETDAHGGGHSGHGGMKGMATPEEMTRLVAAKGNAFDRLFLQLMTKHHEGALAMADEATDARHPIVLETINDVVATQSVEINRMQQVLASLPA